MHGRLNPAAPAELVVRRWAAFAIAFAVPVIYAMRGGTYDLIARQEAGLIVWGLLAIGLILGLLPRSRPPRITLVALGALGVFVILTLLSLGWTESGERTTEELARTLHYGGIVLLAILTLNRYTASAAASGLTLGALLICALAVGSRIAPGQLPTDEVARFIDSDRLSYPLDYWNGTAAWGAIALAGALAWSAQLRKTWMRSLYLAAVPLAALTVYLSYSRGGVIGTAAAAVVVVAVCTNRWTAAIHIGIAGAASAAVIAAVRANPQIADGTGSAGNETVLAVLVAAMLICGFAAAITRSVHLDRLRLPPAAARAVFGAGAVVAVLALAIAAKGPLGDAWDEFSTQQAVAVGANADPAARLASAGGSRNDVWNAALDAFADEPLSGIGPGSFEYWWSRNGDSPEYVRDAHSVYLEQLAELGLPGLLALLVFLGGLAAAGLVARSRLRRSDELAAVAAMLSMFAVFLVHAGIDWMWELTGVTVLGLGAGAIAAALASGRRTHGLPIPWRAGLAVLIALAVVAQIPSLVSTARTRESESALEAGDVRSARELADEAVDAEPWGASSYLQRAAISEGEGRYGDARDDLLEAIDNEPTNWRQRILLAQIYLKLGDEREAKDAFAVARELNPNSRFYTTFPAFRYEIIGGEPPPALLPPALPDIGQTANPTAPFPER